MVDKEQLCKIVSELRHIKKIHKEIKARGWENDIPNSHENFSQNLYDYLYPEKVKTCVNGGAVKFVSFSVGYRFCGTARNCQCAKESVAKNVSMTKLGYDAQTKSDIHSKRVDTVRERYGVENVFQCTEVIEKSRSTKEVLYGDCNYRNSTKAEETCLRKYGGTNPMHCKSVREKVKDTNIERYGQPYPSQNPDVIKKQRDTMLERYGVESPIHVAEIREKIENTNIDRYGSSNPVNSEQVQKKISRNLRSALYDRAVAKYDMVTILTTLDDYVSGGQLFVRCNACGNNAERPIDNGIIPICRTCYPLEKGTSVFEKEVAEFVLSQNFTIKRNVRGVIGRKELDIYVPDRKFAIECNGVYWHSELSGGKNKKYHIEKYNMCIENGISLMSITDEEWYSKRDLICSMIKYRLGCVDNRVYARDTIVRDVSMEEAYDFCELHHFQGAIGGSVAVGLFLGDVLVACMVLGKPRYNNTCEWELLRLCVTTGHSVVGGASKMYKFFLRNYYVGGGVVSYARNDYGINTLYERIGFMFDSGGVPGYRYVKNGITHSRIGFQKHKLSSVLEKYDEGLTEWENMQMNGYDRIWDTGSSVWIYR